ncbi:MAG: SCO family protein [Novosphingobium sp. 16-62-11]|uniref:SCO family protein n=1 Tax=Novosphingobium sp. 17-62-19 TaxID=1970406 RepID=UPI000BD2DD9D|nr:SCO family protein [Novosphingobium sp. 17-62-19]OYX95058.1 MAG: SCO family protein [Novosphingobium sp. 35-62-5]OYZ44126.1 MAG: SCO family protein [Novosphingobium sp. 16-62-11]OZA72555.1 MAG: SCO family protein [Sphingomonadales bacterium 39-62-4]HQS97298.1 SCO family protein [Novosphingobium sp.]OZA17204.1 MAG: SCO family protein [Novosphingobium sp. 17-62-19]
MNRRAMTHVFRSLLAALAATCTFALASCGGGVSESPPLEGATIGGDFTLTGKDGKPVRWADFDGKYRIVYFGYTFCPDVCPTDLQNIAQGVKLFGKTDPALAAKVVPIFITIDPQRDTPEVVGKFAESFGPSVVGLTGTPEQIADVAKKWSTYYKRGKGSSPTEYLMDHLRASYLMGPKGEPIALLPSEQNGQAVAAELAKWVR